MSQSKKLKLRKYFKSNKLIPSSTKIAKLVPNATQLFSKRVDATI
jgi:hypothetical protein